MKNKDTKTFYRVAIADDSHIIRERFTQWVKRCQGFEMIWEAETGQEAIEKFKSSRADIVILDIEMPNGHGISVLDEIKKIESETVVIMLTNYPLPPFRRRCLRAGADHFFDKSTEFEKVFETIQNMNINN
ncbi:response regulator transcription factor [bacterium]|nr:response regulator transcription factor [bacterium]